MRIITVTMTTDLPGAFTPALDAPTRKRLFVDARSATEFADKPVPLSVIRDVYDVVKFGPTGNNSGPMRLAIADSPAARATVIAAASEGNKANLEKAPLLLVVARDDRYHDHFEVTAPSDIGYRARLEAMPDVRAARAHDGTWLQAGYLIVGLRGAGLALRPYGGFDKVALSESLLGDTSWAAEMLLGVGYPAVGDHGAGPRRGRLEWDQAARVF